MGKNDIKEIESALLHEDIDKHIVKDIIQDIKSIFAKDFSKEVLSLMKKKSISLENSIFNISDIFMEEPIVKLSIPTRIIFENDTIMLSVSRENDCMKFLWYSPREKKSEMHKSISLAHPEKVNLTEEETITGIIKILCKSNKKDKKRGHDIEILLKNEIKSQHLTVHTFIDYLSDMGEDESVDLMVKIINDFPDTINSHFENKKRILNKLNY